VEFDRPDALPEWASQDRVDPDTSQNNVVTPPIEKQKTGWAFKEFPPRNWFNWLARLTWQWLGYLSERCNRAESYVVSNTPSAAARGAGAMIYVTDETDGPVLAVSDGTNWRRVTDRAIIS